MLDFSSVPVLTILPNGDNDNVAVLKESQHNFDRPIENGSFENLYSINSKVWEFHKLKHCL